MAQKIGPNTAIVSSKELGTNCWSPKRVIGGGRCDRVMVCDYPDKKDCQAVASEVAYLYQKVDRTRTKAEERAAKIMAEADRIRAGK